MTAPARRSFIMPAHLVVPAEIAPRLHALLAEGRKIARRDGLLMGNDAVLTWLADLDEIVAAGRTRRPEQVPGTAVPPEPVEVPAERWIPTAEAAALLGVNERTVRRLRIDKRKVCNALRWSEADVLAEVAVRAELRA